MPVIREVLRTLGQSLVYGWRLRRPGIVLFVLLVGGFAAVAALIGFVAPVAIYPLL